MPEGLGADTPRSAAASQEIVDLVHAAYDWVNREHEPTPMWLPDGEYVNSREDPDHAVHRGIDAIRALHRNWFDAYPDLHVEPLEIKANGERVFIWVRFSGHGAGSGAAMEMEMAHIATLEGDRTRSIHEYFDRGEALRATGLDPAA